MIAHGYEALRNEKTELALVDSLSAEQISRLSEINLLGVHGALQSRIT